MSSLKEEALAHEKTTTKVVSDLPAFDINMDVHVFVGTDSNGEAFSYKYIEDKEGVRYRVPNSVLEQIKEYLTEVPEQKLFKVKKTGEGLGTKYMVMPK